ncbi:hypothetical protein RIF29_21200 [Crotalaria pallida]|uniref:TIR domain-containing protein n=1 Tax=Crotalaria pallida TaxID=3830 RepID=A0AAN9F669_CROPI
MASSSSSSSSSFHEWKYHVFISFRGADTRLGFAGYLNDALCNSGMETFFDDEKLQKGAEITTTLDEAIRRSRIGLVIFSKDYASSTWCLEELVKIMEYSKDKAKPMSFVPIFYRINPSDLRYHKGSYAYALAKHESRIKEKWKIEKWRSALNKAAGISGFHLEPDDKMYEHKFTKEIVQYISEIITSLVENDPKIVKHDNPVNQSQPPELVPMASNQFPYEDVSNLQSKKCQNSQPMQQLTKRQIQPHYPAPGSIDLSNHMSNLAVSRATRPSSSIEKRTKGQKDKNKEKYDSGYRHEEEFFSSKEDYGSGYGRKSKLTSHEEGYGSGYPKLKKNGSASSEKEYGFLPHMISII